jgi:hypothetical protein
MAYGDEWAFDVLFERVERSSGCILILEDMDCRVKEHINSTFLSKLDGL